MNTTERELVTIVAEAVVEKRLIADVKACGARGYSLSHGHGEGGTGARSLDVIGPSVRLETVVGADTANAILEMLSREYFGKFAVVAWVTTVRVARPERF